jgi:protein-disulfide isomerase
LGLIVSVAGGTFAAVQTPAPATTAAEVKARDPKFYEIYTKLPVVPAHEIAGREAHVKGRPDAEVTIVEFSDFACPACGQAFPDLRDLVRSRNDVRLVFRHFPLDSSCNPTLSHSVHPDSCLAAEAAECAGAQNRFWEYHDTLFGNQKNLDRQSLFRYARDLGLDIATFRTCLDDPATRARVTEDVEAGNRADLASTPTLFINGRRVQGALDRPYYDYALVIEKHERDARASRGG